MKSLRVIMTMYLKLFEVTWSHTIDASNHCSSLDRWKRKQDGKLTPLAFKEYVGKIRDKYMYLLLSLQKKSSFKILCAWFLESINSTDEVRSRIETSLLSLIVLEIAPVKIIKKKSLFHIQYTNKAQEKCIFFIYFPVIHQLCSWIFQKQSPAICFFW